MKFPVVLSIEGRQSYAGQKPEVIELVTEGVLNRLILAGSSVMKRAT